MIGMLVVLEVSKVNTRRAEAILPALKAFDPYNLFCIWTPTACPTVQLTELGVSKLHGLN